MEKLSNITPTILNSTKAESPIEKILYFELKRFGIECELQYQLKGIRCDIGIPSKKLIIECDGKEYHKDKLRDKARDIPCNKQGWKVERFTGSKIWKNSRKIVLDIIRKYGLKNGIDDYDKIKNIKMCSNCGGYGNECVCK